MKYAKYFLAVIFCNLLFTGGSAVAQWVNHPSRGIPRLPDGRANLTAPAPRTLDGKPDISGVWSERCYTEDCVRAGGRAMDTGGFWFFDLAIGLPASDVQMTPWAAAIQAQREARDHVDDPLSYCLLPGVPRIDFAVNFKIISTPDVMVFLNETQASLAFRQIFADGRSLPEMPEPTWLGYSTGKWEEDTFVVETIGLKDGGWIDTRKGRPHSDALHVTERFRRIDVGHLELAVTIDDPKAYLKPWTAKTVLNLMPDSELLEMSCERQDRHLQHRSVTPPPPEPPSPRLP